MATSIHDDLAVVVSELVTNAVQHAGLQASDPIRVSAELRERSVLVSVCDRGRGIPDDIPRRLPEASALSGRGLFIVTQLADAVIIDGPRGKVSAQIRR